MSGRSGTRLERVAGGKIMQSAIDILEGPGITKLDALPPHLSLGGNAPNIPGNRGGPIFVAILVKNLEAIDNQIFMLAERHGRPLVFTDGGEVVRRQAPGYCWFDSPSRSRSAS